MHEKQTYHNEKLSRAILLKISFRPKVMFKTQAYLLYAALAGQTFSADIIPLELREKADGTRDCTTPGAATSALRALGLTEMAGRIPSPAKSRHNAEVKTWRLAKGKRKLALAWLSAQGYPPPEEADGDLWTLVAEAAAAEKLPGWEYSL